MKPFIHYFLLFLLCSGCSSPDLPDKKTISENHPLSYYRKSKDKKEPLKQRLDYLTKAEKKAIELNIDSIVIKSLSFKASLFKKNQYKDSILPVLKRMLAYASKAKDSANIGKAYFKLGESFLAENIHDSAFYYFDKSKYIYISLKDSSEAGKKMDKMGRILINDGNYNLGESILTEALEYLVPIRDSIGLASVYLNLSIKYREQKFYTKAKNFVDQAYRYAYSSKSKKIIENTKLLILRENKEYHNVIKRYNELIKDKDISKDKKEYARILDNLAYTQWLSGNMENIEAKLKESLFIRDSLQDTSGLVASYEHLMEYYKDKNASMAIQYAKKLLELTIKQNNVKDRLDAIEYLKTALPDESTKYATLELKLKDSILEAQKRSGNRYAAMIYETSNLEKKLFQEEKEKELINQKRITQNTVYASIGSVIVVSSVFLFLYLRNKHKKEKILVVHNTEKRLSKKLHDELGNDVFYLMSRLQNETNLSHSLIGDAIINGLNVVYQKIRNFSRDYKIETGIEYGDEIIALLNAYGNQDVKIITNSLDPGFWSSISDHKKTELYRTLQELLTNMKKHSKATIVSVTIFKEKKSIVVKYIDNGIGADLHNDFYKNGLCNVENRIRGIKGTITFESKPQQGFISTIKFPS